jgi:enoyl-[acyl-carrier protein] reductase III
MNSTTARAANATFEKEVLQIFAEVTRFPATLLELDAGIEEDLGIDSVKLAAIFAVLRDRYNLPDPDQFSIPWDSLRSIRSIIIFLEPYAISQPVGPIPADDTPIARLKLMLESLEKDTVSSGDKTATLPTGPVSLPDLEQQIVAVFAEVTRYPKDLLVVNAHLEEDLGIDSVKLGEVFATLRQRYKLPPPQDMILESEALSSIAGIAEALAPYMSAARPEMQAHAQAPTNSIPRPGATSAKPDQAFLEEFMRDIATMLHIPLQLLRPDDHLESDLSFDSDKLKKTLSGLDAKYELADGALEQSGIAFNTLRDIATAIVVHMSLEGEHKGTIAKSTLSQDHVFENKVCFISGAQHGKEIASYLAERGATVIINTSHPYGAAKEPGRDIISKAAVHYIRGSMADPAQIDRMFNELDKVHGGIDFFFANAADEPAAPLAEMDTALWTRALMTGVAGMQQACLRAMKMMKKRGGGKIITLSSTAAHRYTEYHGCTAAINAATETLTRYMAAEFALYNIQVNCVSTAGAAGDDREQKANAHPNAGELTHFIGYLLSDDAKITGNITTIGGS